MKIRTIDELQDYIDREMSWRRKELSAIKSNIFVARKFAKNTALRSGIAILYAHWEGMVKNIAMGYLSYVSNQRLKYREEIKTYVNGCFTGQDQSHEEPHRRRAGRPDRVCAGAHPQGRL